MLKHAATLLATTLLLPTGLAAQTAPRAVPSERADQNAPATTKRVAGPRNIRTRGATPTVRPFILRSIDVEGSSIDPVNLAPAWATYLGREITGADLGKITDAVAAIEERNDVALYTVVIPDQPFADGIVRLKVVEGYVEGVKLEGDAEGPLVNRYMARIVNQKPLRRSDLQRYVSLTRDVPALDLATNLVSGTREGAVQIGLGGDQPKVQVGLGVTNRGTALLGRTQIQGDLYLNGIIGQGDQTRLTVAVPTDIDRFQYYAVAHSEPLDADGTTLLINAGYLRTKPLGTGVTGNAKSLGVQLSRPVLRSYDKNITLTLGIDGLNADNAFLGSRFSDERPRAVRGAASFSLSNDRRLLLVSGTLSQGVDALGASTRIPAITELAFTKANARIIFNQAIGKALVARFQGAGQYSRDRLPGSEQFALGGDQFGRAYEASFIAGDQGYAGSAELALRPTLPKPVAGSELYIFADGGRVTYNARAGFSRQNFDLGSVGGGTRLAVASRLVLGLEATRGLSNPIVGIDRKRWRAVFSARTMF